MFLRKDNNVKSLKKRILKSFFITLTSLFFIFSLILYFSAYFHYIREHTHEIEVHLTDLIEEYQEYKGDIALMKTEFKKDLGDFGYENIFLLLSSPSGELLTSSENSNHIISIISNNIASGKTSFKFKALDKSFHFGEMIISVTTQTLQDGCLITIGKNVTDEENFLNFILYTLSITFIVISIIFYVIINFLSKKLTNSLQKIGSTAKEIALGNTSLRVSTDSQDKEFVDLINAFNTMCDSNDKAIEEMKILTDNIAHDLRTPFTRLLGFAELSFDDESVKNELPEKVSEICSDTIDMIETMLEISQTNCKIESSPRREINIVEVINQCINILSLNAEQKNITISFSHDSPSILFSGHISKLQQVFGNLIDNAIKFTTENGSINVSVAQDKNYINITISDTGIGIDNKEIDHIFDRFYRCEKSRSTPGYGLGLALVKAIITSYGGKISCSSKPNIGTTFVVSLPSI